VPVLSEKNIRKKDRKKLFETGVQKTFPKNPLQCASFVRKKVHSTRLLRKKFSICVRQFFIKYTNPFMYHISYLRLYVMHFFFKNMQNAKPIYVLLFFYVSDFFFSKYLFQVFKINVYDFAKTPCSVPVFF
jgi:hypothetical protein